jgi:Tol biopolymer transport system component
VRYVVLVVGLILVFVVGAADAGRPRAAFTFVEYRDNGAASDLSAVLWVVNEDGTDLHRLTDAFPCIDCASDPRFSPDGATIAFGSYYDSPANSNPRSGSVIGAIGIDGKRAHPAACWDCTGLPVWSPDGKRIAATSAFGIVVSDYPTGKDRRLVRDPGGATFGLDWTRDGKWFTYGDGSNRIHVMRADGSHARRIAGDAQDPRFSPDGKTVLFTGTDGWLYLIPREGGTAKRIRTGGSAAWSRDGKRIASISGRTITILDLASNHEQRLKLPGDRCVDRHRSFCVDFDWHS